MHDFQHIEAIERIVRSPFSVGRVESNPLFGRVSMVGIHWTCANTAANTAAKTAAKTAEGDSNTEDEVTRA